MNSSYFFNTPEYKLEVNSNYIYNTYEENETSREENLIKSNLNTSYINLGIKYIEEIDSFKENFIKNIDFTDLINFSNLENVDSSYFNFLNEHQYDYTRMKCEKSNKKLKQIISNNTSNSVLTDDFIGQVSYGNNFLVNNKYLGKIQTLISEDPFGEASEIKNNFFKTSKYTSITDSFFNFNIGFKPFKETNSYTRNSRSILNVGFLIEKYIGNNKVSSNFILNNKLNSNRIGLDSNLNIKDYYVNYGKVYTYLIFPVFYAVFSKEKDYHVNQHFLICSDPKIINIETKEYTRPDTPQALKIKYYNKNDSLYLSWSKPENKQNDIKGYHIYKRNDITEPYTLIGIIDFSIDTDFYTPTADSRFSNDIILKYNKNIMHFEDNNFSKDNLNIYTIVSFDAHGMFSNYSDQIAVLYNNVKKDLLVDLISLKDAPLHMPNLFMKKLTKFFNNDEKIETILPNVKNKTKLTLFITPDFSRFKDLRRQNYNTLKENYFFKVFKLENQSDFVDEINIKNFNG